VILALLAAGTPVAPGRETGRIWAREELAKPAYARARPSLFLRIVQWLLDRLDQVAARAGLGAGQLVAVVLVAAVVTVAVVVLVRRQVRFSGGPTGPRGDVLGASARTGAEHRELAARARAEGRFADAVRESMRAVARRLDERGLLDPRAGRTADELAREAARVLPQLAEALGSGARTFDDVVYGQLPASAGAAEQLRRLDEQVEAARPVTQAMLSTGR
jgi:hypothetical protein